VQNALAHGLINLSTGSCDSVGGRGLVSSNHCFASCADSGLKLGPNCLVASLSLAVGANPLDVGLDVCHCLLSGKIKIVWSLTITSQNSTSLVSDGQQAWQN
jgi:hypothetical protein